VYAQPSTIDLEVHARVDTSQREVKEVVELYTRYLSSSTDSVYDNPYWNSEEKKRYEDFDFTAKFMYQIPSQQLLRYYKPTILSVEKEGNEYVIRTLFSTDKVKGTTSMPNPWCITKVYAAQENGTWKLKNGIHNLTKNWQRKTVGKITFIYPPEHRFNDSLAQEANIFCANLADKFQLSGWQPFDFYIAKDPDQMGALFGFDFYYAGYTTGVGMNSNRMLFSGMDSEWYPHEFVHLLVENKPRHKIIDEGFATWNGGAKKLTFDENTKILAAQLNKNNKVTFTDILDKSWGWQYNAFYTTGAIICQSIYQQKGLAGITALLNTSVDDSTFMDELCKLYGIPKNELNNYMRKEILKYAVARDGKK
jgi:hypothetical protein